MLLGTDKFFNFFLFFSKFNLNLLANRLGIIGKIQNPGNW
jgi:hypothetical protein